MATHAEDLVSQELLLTERICRDLTLHQMSFECQVVCKIDTYAFGYIDILVNSCPPILLEVKGASHPQFLYKAIGQLLAYSSCFPTNRLYLAVPSSKPIAPRLLSVLQRVGISVWEGCEMVEGLHSATSRCWICDHPKVLAIDGALDAKRLPDMVARSFRVNIDDLRRHIAHRLASDLPLSLRQISEHLETDVLYEAHERPFVRFKQAWQDAKDDRQEQHRMVMWLNEQLQSADPSAAFNDFS